MTAREACVAEWPGGGYYCAEPDGHAGPHRFGGYVWMDGGCTALRVLEALDLAADLIDAATNALALAHDGLAGDLAAAKNRAQSKLAETLNATIGARWAVDEARAQELIRAHCQERRPR